ncbi:PDxFFG protein [Mycoplasmopsis agassizii]|uniref:PDxFFG protein n=1 Tax=Mycoplasmopsis agassizii TaxID=33922 RepID=A0ABX4H5S6_9BACT|nr:PDxFFG protein [Mycoplasmopsis agassizii]PAF55208.1 PDxFFG protein [Mycoplasmopsis agassizii]SMC18805.1 hypothetical protein SAMN02745179_00775 [Mycoplasmopsis agassizii]
MKKIPTWGKFAIAAASLSAAVGVVFAGIAIDKAVNQEFSDNKDLVNNPSLNQINYSQTAPISYFVDPVQEHILIAILSPDGEHAKIVDKEYNIFNKYEDSKAEEKTIAEFKEWHLKKYNGQTPVQFIKIGPSTFKNYYTDAITAKEFHEYTTWFSENVAWGPDLVTMKAFNIKKNVVQNGNNITLGSHSNLNKENAEIVFYPDSFYGSLPLYSTQAGNSNASDKLLYQLNNKKFLNVDEINDYLQDVNLMNALANLKLPDNAAKLTFRSIQFLNLLTGKEFYIYREAETTVDASVVDHLFFAKDLTDLETQFRSSYPNLTFSSSKAHKMKLTDSRILTGSNLTSYKSGEVQRATNFSSTNRLELDFANQDQTFTTQIHLGDLAVDDESLNVLNALEKAQKEVTDSFVIFRDFANIKQYASQEKGQETFVHLNTETVNGVTVERFFKDLQSASNTLGTSFKSENIKKYKVTALDVVNNELTISLVQEDDANVTKSFKIQADTTDQAQLNLFDDFVRSIGYKRVVNPYLINSELETRKDGQTYREFSIYTQIYDGLLDRVAREFPYLLKDLSGEHIVRKINDKGIMEYTLETGTYKGFTTSDRISFLYLLKATDPKFKGVGADFLKYVGAHEYGHHTTLQNLKDVGEKGTSIVGGISPRAGMNYDSFVDSDVYNLYLKARTSKINFDKKNITQNGAGSFPQYSWTDENGNEVVETDDLIFGSKTAGNINETLSNTKRRFLQTFDGLKQAAAERGVTLSDLFLLNAFDFYSGTLNPSISGKAKYYVFDENGKASFQAAEIPQNGSTFIKDGQGKPITFIDGMPQVVRLEEGSEKKLAEVLIHNKDGSPVISTAVGQDLTDTDRAIIKQIEGTILELIQVPYTNNGWETDQTSLTNGPTFTTYTGYTSAYIGRTEQYFIKYWENNFNENETNYIPFATNWRGNSNRYSLPVIRQYLNLPYDTSILNSSAAAGSILFDLAAYIPVTAENNTSRGGADLRVDEWSHGYTSFNFIDTKTTLETGEDVMKSFVPNPTTYNGSRFVNARNLNLLGGITPLSLADYGIEDNRSGLTRLFQITNAPNSNALFQVTNIDTTLMMNAQVSGQNINFYQAFNESVKKPKRLVDAIEFLSLDYSKITRSEDGKGKVFDINYAKTKFDLEAYKTALLANAESEIEAKNFTDEAQLNEVANDEQKLANHLMSLFEKSAYNVFLVNLKLGENFETLGKLMDPATGVSSFFKDGFVLENPNKAISEFTAPEVKDGLIKKLKSLNLDTENVNKVTISDAFYLMNIWSFTNDPKLNVYDGDTVNVIFNSKPSDDVITYNEQRLDTDISQKFTDYVYSIAEVLTRDYIQITYTPDTNDLHNLPDYLTGATESNTGFEYFLDPSSTLIWNESKVNFQASQRANDNDTSLNVRELAIAFSQLSVSENRNVFEKIKKESDELLSSPRANVKEAAEKAKTLYEKLNEELAKLKPHTIITTTTLEQQIQERENYYSANSAELTRLFTEIKAKNQDYINNQNQAAETIKVQVKAIEDKYQAIVDSSSSSDEEKAKAKILVEAAKNYKNNRGFTDEENNLISAYGVNSNLTNRIFGEFRHFFSKYEFDENVDLVSASSDDILSHVNQSAIQASGEFAPYISLLSYYQSIILEKTDIFNSSSSSEAEKELAKKQFLKLMALEQDSSLSIKENQIVKEILRLTKIKSVNLSQLASDNSTWTKDLSAEDKVILNKLLVEAGYESAKVIYYLQSENQQDLGTYLNSLDKYIEKYKKTINENKEIVESKTASDEQKTAAQTELAKYTPVLTTLEKVKSATDLTDAENTLVTALSEEEKITIEAIQRVRIQRSLLGDELLRLSSMFASDYLEALTAASTYENAVAQSGAYLTALRGVYNRVSGEVKKLHTAEALNTNYGNWVATSNYFGQINKLNNGFFKDRWQKEIVDWALYDDSGKSIEDTNLRITDLENKVVTDRARAFWMYLLKSKGVSERTLTGIYRDKEKDSNVFWGFMKLEDAQKVKNLAFEDAVTGEVKYLKVNFENTNNLFYFQTQGDSTSKRTLADEGYTSWISDFAIFAKYSNAFIIPDSKQRIFFVDENNKEIEGLLNIGTRTAITENGKTQIQSPTMAFVDKNGKLYFNSIDQFNL